MRPGIGVVAVLLGAACGTTPFPGSGGGGLGDACASVGACRDGLYCDFADGRCGGGEGGVCRERPQGCTADYAPVCGCDGRIHGNPCGAASVGVDVATDGRCASAACSSNAGCGPEEYCDLPTGSCDAAGAVGTCRERPTSCSSLNATVCGCDGRTYPSSCAAHREGVNVRREGACDAGRCSLLSPCRDPAQFCDYEPNTCGRAESEGVCRTRPDACTREYAPVCGCDGRTHGNACTAYAAGVDVAATGECPPIQCREGDPCPEGYVCDYEPPTCGAGGATGACRKKPDSCEVVCIQPGVCGCDGRSYCDACAARAAGTDVAYERPGGCEVVDTCGPDRACPSTHFCDYPDAACGTSGLCRPRPQSCLDVWEPVCGCNGQTYSNACYANAAGIDVRAAGECAGSRTCSPSRPCEAGEWCDYERNTCGRGGDLGACQARPDACPEYYRPVCGCNAVTYGNPCEAQAAGFDVAYEGPCDGAVACTANEHCPDRYFCNYEPPTCGLGGEAGTCWRRPGVCPLYWAPVCGCDGMTYGNACEANAAGTDVASNGACEKRCGGIAGFACADNEYCDFEPNTCGFADQMGVCRPRPDACPLYFACIPLCGCNGVTYCNECEAAQAGTDVAHEGACEEPARECALDRPCPEGATCDWEPASCGKDGAVGKCVPRPLVCPLLDAPCFPMCGCDGRTYCSECEAFAAGTDIAASGFCATGGP